MTLSLLLSILLLQGAAVAKGGVVAGTLRITGGNPAAGVRVGAMAIPEAGRGMNGAGTLVSQGKTDDAGRFELENVPAGRYYIVAGNNLNAPTFYPGVQTIGTARTIEVRAMAAVRDIDFEVVPSSPSVAATGVNVTGRIVLKNNPNALLPPIITLQGSRVLLPPTLLQGVPLPVQLPSALVGISETVAVSSNGSFNVTLPVGDQRLLRVSLPEAYSVVSVTSGGRNVLNQSIDVKAGFDLLVTVDVGDMRTRYRLMALVREDSTERPLAGERVELVQSSGDALPLTVNAQGMVTVPGLLQGTYVLRLVSASFEVPAKQVVITNGSVQVELRARKKP